MGYYTQKRPNVLSIFCYGLESELTRTFRYGEKDGDRVFSRKLQAPLARINPAFDMVTIINVVCSLLALVIVFDSVCGERQSGTLKLLLSGPVPKAVVILAKAAAGLVVLLAPLLISWLLSVLYVFAVAASPLALSEWIRLGGICLLSIAYITLFFAAGMAASTFFFRSATSLSACMVVWAVLVLIAPPALPHVARAAVAAPTRAEIEKAIMREHSAFVANAMPSLQRRLAGMQTPAGMEERVGEALDNAMRRREREMRETYLKKMKNWHGVAASLLALSPSSAFAHVVADLAGTGIQSYYSTLEHFSLTRRSYIQVRWKWRTAEDPALLPAFAPPRPPLRGVVNTNAVGITSIVVFAVLFLLVSVWGFVRQQA